MWNRFYDIRKILFLGILCPLICWQCKSETSSGEQQEKIVILCGNSFIPPTEALIKVFKQRSGITATFTTGGSEDMLPHVKAQNKGDIFITHDPFLKYTKDVGSYADHVYVGFVAPVIAVQKGNPLSINRIENLAEKDIKIALSDPLYSTCGKMVFDLLDKKNIKEQVLKNVGNRLTKGHSHLGNLLKTKTVDAVLMWNGVANTFKDDLDVVKTPYEYDKEIGVIIIGLNYSPRKEVVKKFMAFVKKEGKRIFAEHGYDK